MLCFFSASSAGHCQECGDLLDTAQACSQDNLCQLCLDEQEDVLFFESLDNYACDKCFNPTHATQYLKSGLCFGCESDFIQN